VLMGTSICLLLFAVVWTQIVAGTTEFRVGGILGELPATQVPILLALFAFGTAKAALMPFHRWLPAAMVAPTPVSALLHAVAVVKAGVFTITKVVVYVFGLDLLRATQASGWLVAVAAFTLLSASIVALHQDNLKRRLAYSTVSQLAYVVLAATLANALSLGAGGLHIAAHALAKITLFFCAGVILVSLHKTTVTELRGMGRAMPVTMTAWTIASLCIIGLPLTGGFWSKWYLAHGALATGNTALLGVVLLGSLLAMGYLLPPAVRAFYPGPTGDVRDAAGTAGAEGPRTSVAALGVTACLSALLFFLAEPLWKFLGPAVR